MSKHEVSGPLSQRERVGERESANVFGSAYFRSAARWDSAPYLSLPPSFCLALLRGWPLRISLKSGVVTE